MEHLKEVIIEGLWGTGKGIVWKDIHPDVNILVGINGSGKTTLLNLIWGLLNNDSRQVKRYKLSGVEIRDSNGVLIKSEVSKGKSRNIMAVVQRDYFVSVELISTFDVIPIRHGRESSPLTLELLDLIYTTGQGRNTFFDYRLKASNFPDQAVRINERIQALYKLINKQFSATNKRIEIDVNTNRLVFRQDKDTIQLAELSSGEKQFLLIIFKVFLMEEKPYLLLMDEPEISLDVDWQFELINVIRELNPCCQIIISTHSPSIFGDGWGDKVVYMEDISHP